MNPSWYGMIAEAPPVALLGIKITLVLGGAWAAHFALARVSPRWRVLLWRGVALGLLALPLLAAFAPALRVPLLPAKRVGVVPPDFAPPLVPAEGLRLSDRLDSPPDRAPEPTPPARAPLAPATWAAIFWGVVALLCAARFALAQRAMGRVIRRAAPAPESIQRIFERTAARMGVRGVRLAVSGAVRSPLLHGLSRPVVLLPERMTGAAFAEDLPAIFAHELHHAKARDLAWLGLARCVQILLWPHPLAWRLHAAYSASTERATDAAAARTLENRGAYARALARVALALAGRPVQSVALAMAIPDIRRRLIALTRESASKPPRRGAVGVAAVLALTFLVTLSAFKPVQAEPKLEPGLKWIGGPASGLANESSGGTAQNANDSLTTATQKKSKAPAASISKQTAPAPSEMILRIYKINEQDGPRIRSLIDSIISATSGTAFNLEHKIFIDKDDLIVRDTPENITKIEELLLDKKFIQDMRNEKLEIANFSLVPRDTEVAGDQIRAFADRVVTAIKVFLYSQEGESKAMQEGRRLWYDRNTMQLTVVDTPANLARVGRYIESLPGLDGRTRQDVIFLKYTVADWLTDRLNSFIASAGPWPEIVFKIRPGETHAFYDYRIDRVLIVPRQLGDSSGARATFTVTRGARSETLTMRISESRDWEGIRITAEDVIPPRDKIAPGSLRLRLKNLKLEKSEAEQQADKGKLEGITVSPFGELNALIVRYTNPDSYKQVMAMIKVLDQPTPQFSIETKLIAENTTITRAQGKPFDPVADLGLTLQKCFRVERRDRTSSPTLTPIQLPVLASGGKTSDQALEQKLRAQQTAGRLNVVHGPRVTLLRNQESVFRIETRNESTRSLPAINQVGEFKDIDEERPVSAAVVLRLTPDVGKDPSRIHLKNLSIQLVLPRDSKLFDELSARAAADPEAARRLQELRARTRKEFDIEIQNGEAVLLTAPEFEGFHVLLTTYIVE